MNKKVKPNLLILNLSEYDQEQINLLKKYVNIFNIENANKKSLDKLIKKLIKKKILIDYFISNFGVKLDNQLIDSLSNLKLVLTPTTGTNHIDVDHLKRKKIKFFSLFKNNEIKKITSTAEHTWALILSISRNLTKYNNDVLNKGEWNRKKYLNFQLNKKTLGIVGYGRLGKMVNKYAKAFSMKTLIYDKKKIKNKSSLKKIFSNSDIITIHLELNPKTRFIINKKIINYTNKKSIIINTSRGEIIDENFLFDKLKKNKINYFGTDVLIDDHNWNKKVPVKKKKQINKIKNKIIITPHVGGNTVEANKITRKIIFNQLFKVLKKA